MAAGSGAGFFGQRKAPAVLKHALLSQHVAPFLSMTGSVSTNGRVVFLDGYAGEGRYADGSPGSPMLAMETAKRQLPNHRILDCVFVEKDRKAVELLKAVTEDFRAQGVRCAALAGGVEDHIFDVIRHATNAPLFMFLDPFGVPLPFTTLTAAMTGERQRQWPPTEVLLNLSDQSIRRIVGQLKPDAKDRSALPSLNLACGGEWWQETYLSTLAAKNDKEAAVQAVVGEYAARLGSATKSTVISVPVYNREEPAAVPPGLRDSVPSRRLGVRGRARASAAEVAEGPVRRRDRRRPGLPDVQDRRHLRGRRGAPGEGRHRGH